MKKSILWLPETSRLQTKDHTKIVFYGSIDLPYLSGSHLMHFYTFLYDWRKDNREHAEPLNKLIKRVRQEHPQDKIIVMAHSMGGLVARYYAVKYPNYADDIEAFIFMATPHHGSPRAYQGIALDGYNFGNQFMTYETGKRLAVNLPAAYQLLPTYEFITDISTKRKLSLDEVYRTDELLTRLLPNKALLEDAIKFHREIGEEAPSKVPSIHIAGVMMAGTLVGLDADLKKAGYTETLSASWYDFTKVENQAGDMTVPAFSSRLQGATHFYVEAKHGDVPGAPQTLAILRPLLNGIIPAQGQTYEKIIQSIKLRLNSHPSLHVYDKDGNHAGINEYGLVEEDIPGSEFHQFGGGQYIFLSDSKEYTVKILGESNGIFTFESEVIAGGKYTRSTYSDVPIDNKVNATLTISGGQPSPLMKTTGEASITPEVQSTNVPTKMLIGATPITPSPTPPPSVLFPSIPNLQYLLTQTREILSQPMTLLVPSTLWMAIALVFGLALRSGKKGALIAIAVSVLIAYYMATWNLDLISLSLKTVLLLPGILIGASIGGAIGRRFVKKKHKPS